MSKFFVPYTSLQDSFEQKKKERRLFVFVICTLVYNVFKVCPDPNAAQCEWLIYWLYDVSCRFQRYFSYIAAATASAYPFFPGVLFTTTPHDTLSRPLDNGQRWERNESCRNVCHRSSERILFYPRIEPSTSCSQVMHDTNWAMLVRPAEFELLTSIHIMFQSVKWNCIVHVFRRQK